MKNAITETAVSWNRSIRTKVGLVSGAILFVLAGAYAGHVYEVGMVKEGGRFVSLLAEGVRYRFEARFLGNMICDPRYRANRDKYRARIREILTENAARYETLLNGNQAEGLSPLQDPEVRTLLTEYRIVWANSYAPRLEVLASNAADRELLVANWELNAVAMDDSVRSQQIVGSEEKALADRSWLFGILQALFFGIAAVAAMYVLWFGQILTRRIRNITRTASAIAEGDLTASAETDGEDEVAVLGVNLNTMTTTLRGLVETERKRKEQLAGVLAAMAETIENLATASVEILAATAQQTEGAQESAAAVVATVTTVDEIGQTAEQSAERAKAVADSTRRAVETGKVGRKAVEDTIAVMRGVRESSESIAQSILALAEQSQAIGEIAAAINDIADQLNLLALNATIEASRAGEQGKGFGVVATEVRALADQAKKATVQVRQILDASQKNTNAAVIATEEGIKRVGDAVRISGEAGETIRGVAELIAEASEAAVQTAAGAGQSATGMTQVTQALKHIDSAAKQNIASTRQTEKAIQDLTAFGERMKVMLERSRN